MKEEHAQYVAKFRDHIQILAVRGPRTRESLLRAGVSCPAVYGDPGLLMPLIYPRERECRYRLCVVPHISQVADFEKLSLPSDVRLLSPRRHWRDFIDTLTTSEAVVSSSLHGVILADAYGVPVVPLLHGSFLHGTPFKFEDYFRSTGREPRFLDSSRALDVEEVMGLYEAIGEPRIDLKPLLLAFPYLDRGGGFLERLAQFAWRYNS
jgi:pyruvyltransferase